MSKGKFIDEGHVRLGLEEVAWVRQAKATVVAKILGAEVDRPTPGVVTIWLDRRLDCGERAGAFAAHSVLVTELQVPAGEWSAVQAGR